MYHRFWYVGPYSKGTNCMEVKVFENAKVYIKQHTNILSIYVLNNVDKLHYPLSVFD